MRGLRVLGVGVLVLIGLIGAVPVASAAPPDDRVLIFEFSETWIATEEHRSRSMRQVGRTARSTPAIPRTTT